MKKFNNSKIFFYTGNHNKIAGIADIVDYFKNLCDKNNIKLILSSKLPKKIDETLVIVEEFSKPNEYLNINNKLDSLKSKKILILTEFFDHKNKNLNSFITPKKFRNFYFFINLTIIIYTYFKKLTLLTNKEKIKQKFIKFLIFIKLNNEFVKFIVLMYSLLIGILISPYYCIKGSFFLIRYYFFFSLMFIHKLIQILFEYSYYTLNPTSTFKLLFFLADILNIIFYFPFAKFFLKKIKFRSINEIKVVEKFLQNTEIKYKNFLPVKYLRLIFEKYDNSKFTLSQKDYEFYKKIIWIRQFVINYVFYYNKGLNDNLKSGTIILGRSIFKICRTILGRLKILNFSSMFVKHINSYLLTLDSKIKTLYEYIHNYSYFKIRYLNLMKCINKFNYILRTHEEIKIDKNIINKKNDVIYFSQFEPSLVDKNFKIKKIDFDFSGQFNTYRRKKIKEVINKFKYNQNIFSIDRLKDIILRTNNNQFISSHATRETKFSLHIEKSEIWPYSSPARYINSLQKNEIPIILKDFGDLYSTNMAINLNDLINHHLNIDDFIEKYFINIISFKKQIDLNDTKIVENLR